MTEFPSGQPSRHHSGQAPDEPRRAFTRPRNETDPDRTAFDVKEIHTALNDFTADELRQIPLLRVGDVLTPGAMYLDLGDRERGEFEARPHDLVRAENWIAPKAKVDYHLWNRLRLRETPPTEPLPQ